MHVLKISRPWRQRERRRCPPRNRARGPVAILISSGLYFYVICSMDYGLWRVVVGVVDVVIVVDDGGGGEYITGGGCCVIEGLDS